MMSGTSTILAIDINDVLTEMVLRECSVQSRNLFTKKTTSGFRNPDMNQLETIVKEQATILSDQFHSTDLYRPSLFAAMTHAHMMINYMCRREHAPPTLDSLLQSPKTMSAFAMLSSRHYSREAVVHKKIATTGSDKTTVMYALVEADTIMRMVLRNVGYTSVAISAEADRY
jgi:hypothetical protein